MNAGQEIIAQVGAMSYLGIFGISFLANVFVPVPEEIVILAIGYVAGTGKINVWITIPITILGALACDILMFGLSRRNNPIVRGFYDKFFSKIFPISDEFLHAHVTKITFFARFLVQLRFLGPFLAGQAHMTWKKFLALDVAALIIYVSILIWVGDYFQDRIETIFDGINQFKNIVLILVGIAVLWFLGQFLKKLFLGDFVFSFKKKDSEQFRKTWVPFVWRSTKLTDPVKLAVIANTNSKGEIAFMFTLDQINQAHARVTSGADFPGYVADLKSLGVAWYDTYTIDGHTDYFSKKGGHVTSGPKHDLMIVAEESNPKEFQECLKTHQNGDTDYLTFCKDCARTGVDKWTVNTEKMTCIYYDKEGTEMLVESIPVVQR